MGTAAASNCFPAIFWTASVMTRKKGLNSLLEFWFSTAVCPNEKTTCTFATVYACCGF